MNYLFMICVIIAVIVICAIAAFTNFALDNEHYDRMKWLVMKWHYITAFVALLVELFKFPFGSETVLLVAGIGAAMAGLLGVSTKNYKAVDLQSTFNGESILEMTDEQGTEEVYEKEDEPAEEQ